MDTYITNDPNNPINQQPTIKHCEVCNIEENKTYFVDDSNICENCYQELQKKKKTKTITINLKL